MNKEKIELLIKSTAWWICSTLIAMLLTFFFVGSIAKSALMVVINGFALMIIQWRFEIIWDNKIRENLRNAISRKQS